MRPIKTIATLAWLTAVLPAPLMAQAPSEPLRALLSALPDPTGLPRMGVSYGDPGLARGLDLSAVTGASADPAVMSMRGVPPGVMVMGLVPRRDRTRTAAGFGVADIARIAQLTAIPREATIIDLLPGAGAAVPPALAAMGYEHRDERGVMVWALGEEGPRGRRAERNADDPLRGAMGGTPRVQIDGDRIRHADGSDLMVALVRGIGGSLMARADIAAMAGALDSLPGTGGLVQAMLYPDMAVLRAAPPADLVPGLPATAEWRAMMLADLTDGPQSTGVLLLALTGPDAAGAQALADGMVRAWSGTPLDNSTHRTLADVTGGPVTAQALPGAGGLWLIMLHQTRPTLAERAGYTRNLAYSELVGTLRRGTLPLLQP